MGPNGDFWNGRRVLVTGHTGFKGAWLSLWLQSLGAELTGLSAGAPTTPSLYELARVGEGMRELHADIRDGDAVGAAFERSRPDVVLHLAAQPLVRRALADPIRTYEVNVTGTANVLDAVRRTATVRAVVVVTTDKCYANPAGSRRRFVETDPLGGSDPYSSSKAYAELVVEAYRASVFADRGGARVATARAGNVIGGGDWAVDRIVPDAVRAVEAHSELRVRSPAAVRPWQHVVSPLAGYLALCERLVAGEPVDRAWNLGPPAHEERTVGWVVERMAALWSGELRWRAEGDAAGEAAHLALDSSAAERALGWRPACSLEDALGLVVEWHRRHRAGADMRAVTLEHIARLSA